MQNRNRKLFFLFIFLAIAGLIFFRLFFPGFSIFTLSSFGKEIIPPEWQPFFAALLEFYLKLKVILMSIPKLLLIWSTIILFFFLAIKGILKITRLFIFFAKNQRRLFFIFLSLFLFSLTINLIYFNWESAPFMFPDSVSYVDIAMHLADGIVPGYWYRTPVYPLFLAIFLKIGNVNWATYGHILLNSTSIIFLYLIAKKITRSNFFSLFSALFISLDYFIISFQSTILTEAIIVPLLLANVYIHILFFHSDVKKSIFYTAISDVLLFFAKPTFILLPISLYVMKIVYFKLRGSKNFRKIFLTFGIMIAINAMFIVSWSGLNFFQKKYFGFTEVSYVNTIGKIIQYGYLDKKDSVYYSESIAKRAREIYFQNIEEVTPNSLKQSLEQENFSLNQISSFGNLVIRSNLGNFIKKSAALYPNTLSEDRRLYGERPEIFSKCKILMFFESIFEKINSFKFAGLIGGILFILYLIGNLKNNEDSLKGMLVVVIACLYTTSIITLFSFGEYARLRVPVEPLLIFLEILLPFLALMFVKKVFFGK